MKPKLFFTKVRNLTIHIARYLLDRCAMFGVVRARSDLVVLVKVDGIGDFVLWLESARAMKAHYQDREIVLIANSIFADLAEKLEYFNRVIGVDLKVFENDWRYRFGLIRRVFRLGTEIAIQPTYSRNYTTGDALIRATAARERIGFRGDLNIRTPWQKKVADRWYTRLIPASDGQMMELERNLEFLKGLGIYDIKCTLAEIPPVAELEGSLKIEGEYFIVFLGAGSPKRMWPVESFASVAHTAAEKYGWRMVVCGTAEESDIAQRLVEQACLAGALNLAGQTTLPEFVELVRGARLLIANETSAIHIAAAVGTPSVCLLGGGHFGRFMPYPESAEGVKPVAVFEKMGCYGCNWRCKLPFRQGGPVPCIAAIQTQAVVNAINRAVSTMEQTC